MKCNINMGALLGGGGLLPVFAVLTALAGLFSAPLPVAADIIFDSGVEASEIDNALGSDPGFSRSPADDFTLGTLSTVNEVQWTGLYASSNTPPSTDVFTIEVYDYSGSSPVTTPLFSYLVGNTVNRTDTGFDNSAFDIFSYRAAIPETNLAAGRYMLSIVNNTSADTDDNWFWGVDTGMGTIFSRSNTTGDFAGPSDIPRTLDFTLSGPAVAAVPEPASLALLGTGLAGLYGYGWRRRRRLSTNTSQAGFVPLMRD